MAGLAILLLLRVEGEATLVNVDLIDHSWTRVAT